ncbi:MAG: SsrA-binding protein SmpB [Pseudomonadales bacterium]
MSKKKAKQPSSTIALNKKAKHDYILEDRFEAGMVLEGWEVKSLRAGKCQITDSHVFFKNGEAWLLGVQISPLSTVSSHRIVTPTRYRKLLLSRRELDRIAAAVNQKGYTAVCTAIYWKSHLVKTEIALAKGKQTHDKRATEKERDWNRDKQRVLRTDQRS